jgi:hypothetical protein
VTKLIVAFHIFANEMVVTYRTQGAGSRPHRGLVGKPERMRQTGRQA